MNKPDNINFASLRREMAAPTGTAFDDLDATVRGEVWPRWRAPCQAAFEHLAVNHPGSLLTIINKGRLKSSELTFAAEAAGLIGQAGNVKKSLLPLLDHPDSIVREGAIYGLSNYYDDSQVVCRLKYVADEDPSPAVRAVAADVLSQW